MFTGHADRQTPQYFQLCLTEMPIGSQTIDWDASIFRTCQTQRLWAHRGNGTVNME